MRKFEVTYISGRAEVHVASSQSDYNKKIEAFKRMPTVLMVKPLHTRTER